MSEQPDWTRAYLLMAKDGSGNIIPILVDADGQMYSVLRGLDALGAPQTVKVDSDGQLYVVLRGASGENVYVDSNGYIAAVLKGDHDGTLTNVAVDASGRLSAFVVDSSDVWDQIVTCGNAELAARLGSPVLYHQTGRVVFLEDFSHGLQRWSKTELGTGAAVEISPVAAESGGYSCKLTAGSTSQYLAQILAYTGILATGRIGLAMSYAVDADFDNISIIFGIYDGTYWTKAGVKLDEVNDQILVLTGETTYTQIGTWSGLALGAKTFNHLKFTIDLSTRYYDVVYENQRQVDASARQCYQVAFATSPSVYIQIQNVGESGDNDVVYVDNIILTTNEP